MPIIFIELKPYKIKAWIQQYNKEYARCLVLYQIDDVISTMVKKEMFASIWPVCWTRIHKIREYV